VRRFELYQRAGELVIAPKQRRQNVHDQVIAMISQLTQLTAVFSQRLSSSF
jgi:hypothetical protein